MFGLSGDGAPHNLKQTMEIYLVYGSGYVATTLWRELKGGTKYNSPSLGGYGDDGLVKQEPGW